MVARSATVRQNQRRLWDVRWIALLVIFYFWVFLSLKPRFTKCFFVFKKLPYVSEQDSHLQDYATLPGRNIGCT
jgi:hypothetical protein